jgi:hypothetical protein
MIVDLEKKKQLSPRDNRGIKVSIHKQLLSHFLNMTIDPVLLIAGFSESRDQ